MGFKLNKKKMKHFPFTKCKTRLLSNDDNHDDSKDDEKLLRRFIVKWKEEIPLLVVFSATYICSVHSVVFLFSSLLANNHF